MPKLRFPEFWDAGDWEEKQLGNLSQILRGGSPRPIENFLTTDTNGLNWLKIGDVDKNSKYVTRTQERVRPDALSKTREVNPGDLILSNSIFARVFLPKEAQCSRFINADLIAAGLSPFAPETAAIRAGRLMLEEIAASVRRGESFALETTLSGLSYLRHISQCRTLGYCVNLYFLSLPSAEIAVARVAERVRQGGHDIPEPVIRRRFTAGLHNLVGTTKP